MSRTKINGISFPNKELHQWGKQHTKEQFYARAKSIYWKEFDVDTQMKSIDEMWAVAESGNPKKVVDKPKEDEKPTTKK